MPNWCECELVIKGKQADLDAFCAKAQSDKEALSFARFIPKPPELDLDAGGSESYYDTLYGGESVRRTIASWSHVQLESIDPEALLGALAKGHNIAIDEARAIADKYKRNQERFGHTTWYTWCVEKWGTKWDARHVDLDSAVAGRLQYMFSTAWSPPLPVIGVMSEQFPSLLIDLKYWEGSMGFAGRLRVKNRRVRCDDCHEYYGSRGG
jgi:hypothetical protein